MSKIDETLQRGAYGLSRQEIQDIQQNPSIVGGWL